MATRYTFRGGVRLTRDKTVMKRPVRPFTGSERVVLFLRAFEGAPCVCRVEKGEYVRRGQCIGWSDSEDGMPRYSPVSGHILSVSETQGDDGFPIYRVEIGNDGLYAVQEEIRPYGKSIQASQKEELLAYIRETGVTDERGVPLYLRMMRCEEGADTLLVSCVETETGVYAVNQLLRQHPQYVLNGAKILMKALSLPHTVLAVQDDDLTSVNALQEAMNHSRLFTLRILKTRYPQQDPALIVSAIQVISPEAGQNMADYNMMVVSATECAALYRAFATGFPELDRTVCVDGDVTEAGCVCCPVGTPVRDLIAFCGADPDAVTLYDGGAMRGKEISPADFVENRTFAIWVKKKTEHDKAQLPSVSACIRCGECARVCPYGILPVTLAKAIARNRLSPVENDALLSCTLCGACTYQCPAQIPLNRYFAYAKEQEMYPDEWRSENDAE